MSIFPALVLVFALNSHAGDKSVWLTDSIQAHLLESINTQLIPIKCTSPMGSFESYFPSEDYLQVVSKKYDYDTSRCQRTDIKTDGLYYTSVGLVISIHRTTHYSAFSAEIRLPLEYFPTKAKLVAFLSDLAGKTEKDLFTNYNREEVFMTGTALKGSIMIPYSRSGAVGTLKLDYEVIGDELSQDSQIKHLDIKISTDIQV
jgi:hypothetical protein